MALRRLLLAVAAMSIVAAALPAMARADTVIPAGRSVNEVTVVGEDVDLQGRSLGSVIVIGGDVTVGAHGRADDGITVIGGRIATAPTATVNGDVLQIGSSFPRPSGGALLVALAVLLLARLVTVWLVVRLAELLAGRPAMTQMRTSAAARPLRTGLVGALLVAGLGAAAILLAFTVVGILFSLAICGLLLWSAAAGCALLLQAAPAATPHRRTLVAALAVPLLGDGMLALATIAGAGAGFHHAVSGPDERPLSAATPT